MTIKVTYKVTVYPIKFLLPQTIIVEISMHCYDKLANFDTNTHNSELYLLTFGHFFNFHVQHHLQS